MLGLAALFGALALFWLSTRQFALLLRALAWIAGASLLAWAALDPNTHTEFGLRAALSDAWLHIGDLEQSALAQALTRNASTVARFLPQLTDFFVVAGVALGILSALAFTKGERLERILRPSILAMMGFVAGSVATLAVVAIGLGGQVKPRTFIGYISPTALNGEESVHDGDTFWLGEISLRLWGADAPELTQPCRGFENCGEASRVALQNFLKGSLVQCDQMQSINSGRLTESFGRPLVRCWRIDGAERKDVAAWMIENGLAIPYQNNGRYGYNDEAIHGRERGILIACSLRPDIWRSRQPEAREARIAFERGNPISPSALTMGDCDGERL